MDSWRLSHLARWVSLLARNLSQSPGQRVLRQLLAVLAILGILIFIAGCSKNTAAFSLRSFSSDGLSQLREYS
jgi:hypothetical protein